MNNSFTVLTYSLFFLTLLYIVNYILTLSIQCSGDDYIPNEECCKKNWTIFGSVNLTLILIAIGLIISFVFFYFYF